MSLPLLPGNSFDPNVGKTHFHKSHAFDYRREVPVFVGDTKPGIGGHPIPGQSSTTNSSVFPKELGGGQPSWVAFDRQVLRFYAYFQEAVEERRTEQFRVRRALILFYLEDDTVQVNEPQETNSGIPQGTLIRRHRIPRPPPSNTPPPSNGDPRSKLFYTVEDFNVGIEVTFYGRVFRIVNCDDFTRSFLRKLGVRVPTPQTTPLDPYTQHRAQLTAAMQPLRPYERRDTLGQFLSHDGQVLRFFGQWDDKDSLFGDQRQLQLHYYLGDDTIEVLERVPPNSGRDAVPVFLRRGPLPKEVPPLALPGETTPRTLLNVFGTGQSGRYILDSLKTGAEGTQYYRDSDLTLGGVVNVWGRPLLLCDCDQFTREHYHNKFGVENFTPLDPPGPPAAPLPPQREVPPYSGFGSEEDSLASCHAIIPKPPQKDFKKFMERDRRGLDSLVLRLVARMDSDRPIDQDRRFIIFYYLSDDTISVFETPQRNSGIIGGKFLERGRVTKRLRDDGSPIHYYQAADLAVGARVQFNSHRFVLTDADEYALRYMETHPQQFLHANKTAILAKVSGLAKTHLPDVEKAFKEQDKNNTGRMAVQQFIPLVKHLSQGLLNEHEILTLARAYSRRSYPLLPSLLHLVQQDLRRNNFTDFARLRAALADRCHDNTAFVDPETLRRVCTAAGLPLSPQLIDGTIMNCQISPSGAVDCQQFLQLLNWQDHPLPRPHPQQPPAGAGSPASWSSGPGWSHTLSSVDYQIFLTELQHPALS